MVTDAVLIYREGKLEIPEDLQQEWHFPEGAQLRVVYSASGKVLLDSTTITSTQKGDWHSLQGTLADAPFDLSADLEEDRLRENLLDARSS